MLQFCSKHPWFQNIWLMIPFSDTSYYSCRNCQSRWAVVHYSQLDRYSISIRILEMRNYRNPSQTSIDYRIFFHLRRIRKVEIRTRHSWGGKHRIKVWPTVIDLTDSLPYPCQLDSIITLFGLCLELHSSMLMTSLVRQSIDDSYRIL